MRGVDPDAPLSVHMTDWPAADAALVDHDLVYDFDVVQRVVALGRSAREASRVRVRQPLSRLLVRVPDERARAAIERHADQVLEELNIKHIEFLAADAELVRYRIKPKLPELGKRYGKLVPAIREALAACDGAALVRAHADGQPYQVVVGEQQLSFAPEDVLVETESAEGFACAEEGGFLAGLDTHLDEDLLVEGVARELVRTVQDARKQAGLEISDRIVLRVDGGGRVKAALDTYRDYLMSETLAVEWGGDDFAGDFTSERSLDDESWTIRLSRK